MNSISVLSIPGVPNGWVSLDSRLYHDYESIFGVIRETVDADLETYFESFIWPREVVHQDFDWMLRTPGLAVAFAYLLYHLDAEYRARIVNAAVAYMEEALEQSDVLFLILHSHGNRIGVDALRSLSERALLDGKKVIVLSFAPAYHNVLGGYLPSSLTEEEIAEFEAAAHTVLSFRMKTDLLSGEPPLDKTYLFDPHFTEVLWLGHATIRSRKDVMEVLQNELKNLL